MTQRPHLLCYLQRNAVTGGPGQLKCVFLWMDEVSWAVSSALTACVNADSPDVIKTAPYFRSVCVALLTDSSSLSRECWGVPSLGGLDTWRCRASPLPTVSRHNTKATLSCSRLESTEDKIIDYIAPSMSESRNAWLSSTCVVQVVLQPTFGTLIVELPSPRNKKKQVVPEHNIITTH